MNASSEQFAPSPRRQHQRGQEQQLHGTRDRPQHPFEALLDRNLETRRWTETQRGLGEGIIEDGLVVLCAILRAQQMHMVRAR